MKRSIEAIGNVLLQKGISFEYSPTFLKITNFDAKEALFETASYHNVTKELVLMDAAYNELSFEKVADKIRSI